MSNIIKIIGGIFLVIGILSNFFENKFFPIDLISMLAGIYMIFASKESLESWKISKFSELSDWEDEEDEGDIY